MILNFGSLNIDHVYTVDHFVRPGETLSSAAYAQFAGGKGFNQSIALTRAGAAVCHAGNVGPEGAWLKAMLEDAGVDTTHVTQVDVPTGHALIQVDARGENAIILFGGANRAVTRADVDRVLAQTAPGDYLLLQNEISEVDYLLRQGSARGLTLVFNPSPIAPRLLDYGLGGVAIFIVNEGEGRTLTGYSDPDAILRAMRHKFPAAATVLTLGEKGVRYADNKQQITIPAVPVDVVDTTAAGDTFTGYFLAGLANGESVRQALTQATRAAAICVTRRGAAPSIPTRAELG